MALRDELLALARDLANRAPRHPEQAVLRRAVSTAYYALFHALIADTVAILAPSQPDKLREQVGRTFSHGHMKDVCRTFSSGSPPAATSALLIGPIGAENRSEAQTFLDLQQARHQADYDTLAVFSKTDVVGQIRGTEDSFEMLALIRGEANSHVFLPALLLQKEWSRLG